MNKLEVGKTVYLKAVGNNARYNKEERIEKWEIKKIGRKYYEVWNGEWEHSTIKFHIEDNTQKMDYPDWQLYFSMQEIEDEKEFKQICSELRDIFNSYKKIDLTLEQLRKIKEIIE